MKNNPRATRIEYFIELQRHGALTPKEVEALEHFCSDKENAEAYIAALADQYEWSRCVGKAASENRFTDTVLLRAQEAGLTHGPQREIEQQNQHKPRGTINTKRKSFKLHKLYAAAAALLALAVLLLLFSERKQTTQTEQVSSEVTKKEVDRSLILEVVNLEGEGTVEGESKAQPLSVGMRIEPGQVLRLPVDGFCALAYPDGTQVELQGDTSLTIKDTATPSSRKTLFLSRGELTAEVVPQRRDAAFTIQTPHAETRVLGTSFVLKVVEKQTKLAVYRGRVQIGAEGTQTATVVSADETAFAEPKKTVRVVRAKPEKRIFKPKRLPYTIKAKDHSPFWVKRNHEQTLETEGNIPGPWSCTAWHEEAVGIFALNDAPDGSPAFYLEHVDGPRAAIQFHNWRPFKVEVGKQYTIALTYWGVDTDAFVRYNFSDAKHTKDRTEGTAERLDSTRTWKTFRMTFVAQKPRLGLTIGFSKASINGKFFIKKIDIRPATDPEE